MLEETKTEVESQARKLFFSGLSLGGIQRFASELHPDEDPEDLEHLIYLVFLKLLADSDALIVRNRAKARRVEDSGEV